MFGCSDKLKDYSGMEGQTATHTHTQFCDTLFTLNAAHHYVVLSIVAKMQHHETGIDA